MLYNKVFFKSYNDIFFSILPFKQGEYKDIQTIINLNSNYFKSHNSHVSEYIIIEQIESLDNYIVI